jgi:tungstate transport system substrate-binding protein
MKHLGATLLAMLIAAPWAQGASLKCASTTSTQNSGLFEHILPLFEAATGIKVQVIAVGTGAALQLGKRGDVDVVLVHARELELELLQEGFFLQRRDVMYNHFVIVGPPEDPARIGQADSAAEAFRRIASSEARFLSRADRSGTHLRELKLWDMAGLSPRGRPWYLETGQGMARTLRMASEMGAYTLTDRATFLSLQDSPLALEVLFEGDPALLNQYGVMAVNPKRHPHVHYREALEFIQWLTSAQGQRAIASFRDSQGRQLFYPGRAD